MGLEPRIAGDSTGPVDSGAVRAADWPHRRLTPMPRGRQSAFQVIFQAGAMEAIHAHGQRITDMEICGLLIGHVYQDDQGPFLHITAAVEGRHATHHAAQVTFTSATWDYAHEVLERDYPDQTIVGWYHTHPDFGIFLSGMDLFIQENFFNLPWQVAFVYDPIRREEGVFTWKDGRSERVPHLLHKGGFLSGATGAAPSAAATSGAAPGEPAEENVARITPPAPAADELNPIQRGDGRWQRLRRLVAGFIQNGQ